jgi:hypothetical protein
MASEKFLAGAKNVFEKNEDIHELHFTADGQAFHKKANANSHAKEIGSKEVTTVTREDIGTKKQKAVSDDTLAPKVQNEEKPKAKAPAAKVQKEEKPKTDKGEKSDKAGSNTEPAK